MLKLGQVLRAVGTLGDEFVVQLTEVGTLRVAERGIVRRPDLPVSLFGLAVADVRQGRSSTISSASSTACSSWCARCPMRFSNARVSTAPTISQRTCVG